MPENCFAILSNASDASLWTYCFDASATAPSLRTSERIAAGPGVMPLALSADRRQLFAATRGGTPSLVKYSVDARAARLTTEYRLPIGASLVSLAADRTGQLLFGVSYGSHELLAFSVKQLDLGDPTPRQVESGIRNAHGVLVSDDNRFVYATSLGSDAVLSWALDENASQPLSALETLSVGRGFGPRHLCLAQDGAWLYVLSEFRATVAVFRRDTRTGRLAPHSVCARPDVLADLQDGFARPPATEPQPDPAMLTSLVWAADIHVHPDGRFVYFSERTTNRLFTLRVRADGTLEHAGHVETEPQPRGFRIDPSGRTLLACGEHSTHVSLFSIDTQTGALTLCSRSEGGSGANWVEIVAVDS